MMVQIPQDVSREINNNSPENLRGTTVYRRINEYMSRNKNASCSDVYNKFKGIASFIVIRTCFENMCEDGIVTRENIDGEKVYSNFHSLPYDADDDAGNSSDGYDHTEIMKVELKRTDEHLNKKCFCENDHDESGCIGSVLCPLVVGRIKKVNDICKNVKNLESKLHENGIDFTNIKLKPNEKLPLVVRRYELLCEREKLLGKRLNEFQKDKNVSLIQDSKIYLRSIIIMLVSWFRNLW